MPYIRKEAATMWSKSIEVLNPYEAIRASLEDEWARSPRPRPGRLARLSGWLRRHLSRK